MPGDATTTPCECQDAIPRHVAIIMDGNGRWAQQRHLDRIFGHKEGAQSVVTAIRMCREMGIKYLTLYAFSVENWLRPRTEVLGLMRLLRQFLKNRERDLHENEVRLRVIGRREDLPADIRRELERVMESTHHYTKGQLILALSYGSRIEIAEAAKQLAREAKAGTLDPETITPEMISRNLYAPDVPDPDLLIRTSGELRLSNFLLWQSSYTEFYFTDTLWPDFREAAFRKAIEAYTHRKRRFGNIE